MEPLKFEEHIKNQLQKREIEPSTSSWKKLESRLDHSEKPKQMQLWRVGVAAAIAGGFFFLGTLFNNPSESVVVEQVIVETSPAAPVGTPKKDLQVASENTERVELVVPEPLPKKVEILKTEPAVAVEEIPVRRRIFKSDEPKFVPDAGTKNTVAENDSEVIAVNDFEIDALLESAMAELEQNQSSYAERSLGAEELLQEVEYELEQNFRQKIFEHLKKGFSKAKTAVANRNF